MIELKNVKKSYGTREALRGVSFSLGPGELVGLFGENGAGKSTLMKCVLGLLRYEGEITLDGEPIGRKNIARLSFATSEHSFFPALSPEGHADFYARHFPKFDRKRFDVLMDFFELPLRGEPAKFSTGQKNQFEVVLALSQGADYILMDEPFASLDFLTRGELQSQLLAIQKKLPRTIVLVTHQLEEALLLGQKIVVMHPDSTIREFDLSALPYPRDVEQPALRALKAEITDECRKPTASE